MHHQTVNPGLGKVLLEDRKNTSKCSKSHSPSPLEKRDLHFACFPNN